MNAKMCKKLRRALLKAGYVKVEIKLEFTVNPLKTGFPYMTSNRIPMTFKYPQDSFQRAYRNIKKQHRFGK